ncbi:MAG: glutamate synthase subunit alpha, partial [Dehalococcoidia bacterium]
TTGARISGYIAKKYGDEGLPYGTIDLTFNGSAGQSFGAFLSIGMRLTLIGQANDYVAKIMRGGEIVIRSASNDDSHSAVLAGNTLMYGATGGNLFIRGKVGERFAVRNSGGRAVVEGIGDHGCEYMTDGVIVILGNTGRNFGAGMSNGMAFVLDEKGDFRTRVNEELVGLEQISNHDDEQLLQELIQRHADFTDSTIAKNILSDWNLYLPKFWKVAPKFAATEDGAQIIARKHLKKLKRMQP